MHTACLLVQRQACRAKGSPALWQSVIPASNQLDSCVFSENRSACQRSAAELTACIALADELVAQDCNAQEVHALCHDEQVVVVLNDQPHEDQALQTGQGRQAVSLGTAQVLCQASPSRPELRLILDQPSLSCAGHPYPAEVALQHGKLLANAARQSLGKSCTDFLAPMVLATRHQLRL